MSKISTYEVVPVPKLADKLIGTSVGGIIEDITYNFTLTELLNLFLPNIPANNLQGVLDYGNTATQDIVLYGTIYTTNLEVTNTATLLDSYLNGDTNILGALYDVNGSQGLANQVLTSTGTGVDWVTLPPIFTPDLQQVLAQGNTANLDIILNANIQALDINVDTATVNNNITIDGTITDGYSSVGTLNQVLSSTGTDIKWVNLPFYSATSPLFLDSITGVFSIQQANGTQSGYLSYNDWITFNGKQNAGNYITALTGEATATGPGSVAITLSNPAVTGKVLTGLSVTGGSISAADSILTAFGKVQSQLNGLVGGVFFKGVWNALINNPTLTSSVGTQGWYYIVNVAGTTNLNGITDWQVGDWAIFNGSTWNKVDNTDLVTSVNGQVGAVSLTTDNISEGSTNLYFTDTRSRNSVSATTPLAYNNISGVFSIQVATSSQNGYLTSTDWTTFNSKQNALSGTGLVNSTSGTITYITDNSSNWNTAYNDSIVSAAVTGTGTKTLTLTQQDGGTITASWTDSSSGLTSVGVSMPSAFSVANSPLTSNGTIAVTGAGTASQYVRGDGQLATFPSSGGGGSSVYYYLNGSIAASVVGYNQMSNTAVIGGGTDFNLVGNGLIAQFLTDAGNPNRITIPGGAWNMEMFFSVSSAGGSMKFYADIYKYDGVVFTLIASGSTNPESITGGIATDLYLTSVGVPTTPLTITDRLAIRVYIVDNSGGRTVTLHTEDNNLCQIVTTFSSGVSSLNGLTDTTQYFAVGTSGTDFAINSLINTHTFNLPTASGTNRGALSSADWTTFNDKLSTTTAASTYVPYTGATGAVNLGAYNLTVNGITVGIGSGSSGINTAVGSNALGSNTIGSANTAMGYSSLVSNITGSNNTAYGYYTLNTNSTGSDNTSIGYSSLYSNTVSNNTAIGSFSLYLNNSGTNNTAIGYGAGNNVGVNANTTGSNNIFIGYNSIGTSATDSNKTWIGNSSTTQTWLGGNLIVNGTTISNATYTYTLPSATGTLALVGGVGVGTVTSVAALTLGTSGTDLSSTVANSTTTPVITLNVPTASATNRGALSSTDWTTFNSKFTLPSLTSGSVLFSNGTTITQNNANFFWDNTNTRLGLGTTTIGSKLQVNGNAAIGYSASTAAPTNGLAVSGAVSIGQTANAAQIDILSTGTVLQATGSGIGNTTFVLKNTAATFNNSLFYGVTTNTGSGFKLLDLRTNNGVTTVFTVDGTGATVCAGSVTANGVVLTGNTGTVTSVAALTLGTTGTDLSSTVATGTTTPVITLNVPTASAANRGALSSADWTTFNNKQAALSGTINTIAYWNSASSIASLALATYPSLTELSYVKGVTSSIQTQLNAKGTVTGVTATAPVVSSGGTAPVISMAAATTTASGYLTTTDWDTFNNKQNALTNPVTGTGTSGRIPVFNGTSTLTNSNISESAAIVTVTTTGGNAAFVAYGSTFGSGYRGKFECRGTSNVLSMTLNSATYVDMITLQDSTLTQINSQYFGLNSNVYGFTATGTVRALYCGTGGTPAYLVGGLSSIRASKANIENITDVSWIYDLNPVKFQYRKRDADNVIFLDEVYDDVNYGLIAEDTAPIADFLCNYNPTEDGGQKLVGIEYARLTTPMLKAIQDLKKEIDSLKAEIEILKDK